MLTSERILEVAEEVLRRYGPTKATVVDVARALGVSHGSVYRHFQDKAALRDAVTERWLARICEPLSWIVAQDGPAPERLKRWLLTLIAAKHSRAQDDPELFATYLQLAEGARQVITAHVGELTGQLEQILRDGVAAGQLRAANPARTAGAIFAATAKFHKPSQARDWAATSTADEFEAVWELIVEGLRAD